ncbi:MAG TPA: PRC-barrel domain containing protein [Acidimicrobiia bacterium]|jgi:hypothetical protein
MEIYLYRADVFAGPPLDVDGYDVEAVDGHIGRIDESTYDDGQACLVVDTGFWIFGKKRMIPAGVVDRVDPVDRKIYVGMTKEQIRSAPDYDADKHRDQPHEYHDEVGDYYRVRH